jgi:hypothetical protein
MSPEDEIEQPPDIGIRREGDACFHLVEEEVPEGYIVQGVLIPRDEVVEIVDVSSGKVCRMTLRGRR